MSFFPFRGPPWTPKPRKTRGFLIAPRWKSGTPSGPKHRKTRCFWTPRAKNTVIYRGSGGSEVTPRWARAGRRQGRHATITFGYQPKASGKGTARLGSGRRPDLKATAHAADPKDKRQHERVKTWPTICPENRPNWTLQMQKDPNTIWTRAENRPNRKPKNSFTSPLEST